MLGRSSSKPAAALVSDHAKRQARRILTLEHEYAAQSKELKALRAQFERISVPPSPAPKAPASPTPAADSQAAPPKKAADVMASSSRGASLCIVHFIPPPLRHKDKKELPWIIHTCDGSGCREARHVAFDGVTGFSTFEGPPPEQLAGSGVRACSCQIANHHLRVEAGRVRWDENGLDAVVENDEAAASNLLAAAQREHRDERQVHVHQLQSMREENKRLREQLERLTLQRDAAATNEKLLDLALKEAEKAAAAAAILEKQRAKVALAAGEPKAARIPPWMRPNRVTASTAIEMSGREKAKTLLQLSA